MHAPSSLLRSFCVFGTVFCDTFLKVEAGKKNVNFMNGHKLTTIVVFNILKYLKFPHFFSKFS